MNTKPILQKTIFVLFSIRFDNKYIFHVVTEIQALYWYVHWQKHWLAIYCLFLIGFNWYWTFKADVEGNFLRETLLDFIDILSNIRLLYLKSCVAY